MTRPSLSPRPSADRRRAALAQTTALTLAVLALPAGAQETTELAPVILSGGLTPVAADAFARSATVITAEEIAAKGYRTVQDALRSMPGVAVTASGNSLAQVRIRGAEASHTLVLIDGVRAAGGADEYTFSGLETATIERIEVLRGPQSATFGSNASAGVINIITRTAPPGTHYGLTVEAGEGASATARASHRGERGGLMVQVFNNNDRGFDQSGQRGERDRLQRKGFALTGDWQATEDLTFGATLRKAREFYRYDTINPLATGPDDYLIDDTFPWSKREETTGAIWAQYAMAEGRMTHRLQYEDSVFKQGFDGGPMTRGETQALKYRMSAALDGRTVEEARHLLNLMVERTEDKSSAAPDYRREMNSAALEYRAFLDNGVDLQAGVRRDDSRQFADFTSWNVGLSWRVPETPFRLHASAGRGQVNPSFYELFANDAYTVGNPYLKPEQNRGYDIGVEWSLARGTLDLTYFNEKMRDEITYVAGGPDGRWTYENQAGDSPREGVELAGRWQATEALDLSLAYTYLDAHNPDGSVETRRPRHELALSATGQLWDGRGSLTAEIRHVAGNYDTQWWSYTVQELPDHTTVNLSGGYDLTEGLRLTARVQNLFDEHYQDVWGYATRGRAAYVGLAASW